jgi:hypothetical protein
LVESPIQPMRSTSPGARAPMRGTSVGTGDGATSSGRPESRHGSARNALPAITPS